MEMMKIWFASSEVDPFVKTGGLADVAGSLPVALGRMGIDIRVVMPKYGQIAAKYSDRMEFIGSVEVDLTWRRQYCGIFRLVENGVTCYFLDNEYYFHRDWYYGLEDDGERFAFFCRAILDVLPKIGFKPDIIHLNDWQTGLTSLFLDAHYRQFREDGFYRDIQTVFTIHNLRYQGVFSRDMMDSVLGLSWTYFNPNGIEFNGAVSFMKAGLNFSTRITTVSKTYAEEIRGEHFGENLSGTINRRAADLRGIVNGIDYQQNNPENDARLFTPFSAADPAGKHLNKAALQKQMHLPVKDGIPLVGIISRLVDQKGFDLVARVLEEILAYDVQIIVLGTGDRKYEDMFRAAHHAHPAKVSAHMRYDALLAQRIYASCDFFLMPSLFEPCGLSQLFSMRYGTVPVVRETGGLKDTVIPYNPVTGEGTGFTFANYNAHEMKDALLRGLAVFADKPAWDTLVGTCMRQDFSWDHAAREYEALYLEITEGAKAMPPVPGELA
jgi:starch synthase